MKRVIFILMCGLAFSSTLKAQETDTLRFDRLIIKGPGDDGGGHHGGGGRKRGHAL